MKKVLLSILGVGVLLTGAAGASFKVNSAQVSAYVQEAETSKPKVKEVENLKREFKKLTEEEKKELKEKFNKLSEEEKKELKKLKEEFKNEKDPIKRDALKEKFKEYKNKVLSDN